MQHTQEMLRLGLEMEQAANANENSDGWYTPAYIIAPARATLGGEIDLDPASCAAAQIIVRAKTWYGESQNGLAQEWRGRVWCNPPYSDPLPWCTKMFEGYRSGGIDAGLMLVNAACSPEWAELLLSEASLICFFRDRIKFWHPSKLNAKGSYDRDSMLAYFGPNYQHFIDLWSPVGNIMIPA